MIRAGQLRDFVTIQKPSATLNSAGQQTGWQDVAQAYVSIEPLSGRETLNFKMLQSPINIRVRMRFIDGLTPNMQLVLNARRINIVAVIDMENRHRELELLCTEVQ